MEAIKKVKGVVKNCGYGTHKYIYIYTITFWNQEEFTTIQYHLCVYYHLYIYPFY